MKQKDKCPECDGDGRAKCSNHTTYACEECDGSGYIEEDCPTCNGTGEKKLDSPREKIERLYCMGCDPVGGCSERCKKHFKDIIDEIIALLPDKAEIERQERKGIATHLDKLCKYNPIKGGALRQELGKYIQALKGE